MAKRIALGLLVLAAAAGLLGAQEAAKAAPAAAAAESKMALSLDLFPLVKGLIWSDSDAKNSLFALAANFEYLVKPHFTFGAGADLYFGKASNVDILYLGLAAHGRCYPMSAGMDKFFIDAGLGFNVFMLDGESDADKGGLTGITMSLKAGYKVLFNPKFYVEPAMSFVYAKIPSVGVPTPLGWQPGLSLGLLF